MRFIYCIPLFLFASNVLNAQDTLYKEDGSKKIVHILEVYDDVIKYKLFDNLEGPTYVIAIEDVKRVVYGVGSTAVFYKEEINTVLPPKAPDKKIPKQVVPIPQKPPKKIVIGDNFIAINALHLMLGSLTISYEYTFKTGNNSLRCPVSVGLSSFSFPDTLSDEEFHNNNKNYDGNYYRNKNFSIGLDFYKYPHGKSKGKYFYGPSIEYGQFSFWLSQLNSVPPASTDYVINTSAYYVFSFQNGFLFHPSSHFAISVTLGIGYFRAGNPLYVNTDYSRDYMVIKGGLNVGYNF